jgi:hypothetical protein
LTGFLSTRTYKNIYDVSRELAELSARNMDDMIQEWLGAYYDKRRAFDVAFDNSLNFKYGALNIGGLGATNYGQFCIILTNDFAGTATIAYIMHDSLRVYVDDACSVSLATIQRAISPAQTLPCGYQTRH